jgi:putative copper resistance protein D
MLIGLALAVGGVAWGLGVLRAPAAEGQAQARRRCLTLIAAGSVALAASQVLLLLLAAYVLAMTLGRNLLPKLFTTTYFAAGVARALVALTLAATAIRLRAAPVANGWAKVGVLAGVVVLTGAWLTHAVGRLESRAELMALTVTHQLGAAIWLGGLVQLGALWRLARRDPMLDAAWPELIRRFSSLATAAVVALVLSAIPLTWRYVGSWQGLVGTSYGSLLLLKGWMLAMVLMLGALNRRTARTVSPGQHAALRRRLPILAEAETLVLSAVLCMAASLSAHPPAVDQPVGDQATVGEVVEVFRPKLPRLQTPSQEVMRRSRSAMEAGGARTRAAYQWSNFSHNGAGLILLATSLFALVALATKTGWERHWPLGFVGLAVFVYLRGAANEGAWPFGATALWQISTEGLQHRLAALLVLALGLCEWRARTFPQPGSSLPYVLPVLAAAGGVLLLTHSHAGSFQTKASFLVDVTHSTMGCLAVLLAAARWLELRLSPPASWWAGVAVSTAMLAIALILVFYREANVVMLPP